MKNINRAIAICFILASLVFSKGEMTALLVAVNYLVIYHDREE